MEGQKGGAPAASSASAFLLRVSAPSAVSTSATRASCSSRTRSSRGLPASAACGRRARAGAREFERLHPSAVGPGPAGWTRLLAARGSLSKLISKHVSAFATQGRACARANRGQQLPQLLALLLCPRAQRGVLRAQVLVHRRHRAPQAGGQLPRDRRQRGALFRAAWRGWTGGAAAPLPLHVDGAAAHRSPAAAPRPEPYPGRQTQPQDAPYPHPRPHGIGRTGAFGLSRHTRSPSPPPS
jgi:hypothetical protein